MSLPHRLTRPEYDIRLYAAPPEDSNMSVYLPGEYEYEFQLRAAPRPCLKWCVLGWAAAGLFAFLLVSLLYTLFLL